MTCSSCGKTFGGPLQCPDCRSGCLTVTISLGECSVGGRDEESVGKEPEKPTERLIPTMLG